MLHLQRVFLTLFVSSFSLFCNCEYSKTPVPFSKLATCQEFDIESDNCRQFFPIESIKNYKTNEYKLYLKFYVMASTDANIVLFNGIPKWDVRYTAVVSGGSDNRYSWLRNTNDTTVGPESHLGQLLSPLWPLPITVRQKINGELQISVPGVADPLLVADASDLKEIKAFCMYAWKNKSRWFYNCTEEEDIFLDDAL